MREKLAALEHEQWARWMRHLFAQSTFNADGTATIPALSVERWQRQIETAYDALSEAEKNSDRDEADHVLRLFETESE